MENRDQHPESFLWETAEGYAWMRLLVFAVLFHFGLVCGVGAGKLSIFFKLIRIERFVGVSPAALLNQLKEMELLLSHFQAKCEKSVDKKKRKTVVAMDETFFGDFMVLVLMDLRSGYLLLEDISDDRCYDSWFEKSTPRLKIFGY